MSAPGKRCADCGAVDDLRYARMLAEPDFWLCVDAETCRRKVREDRAATTS